jgi:hypothetical protein
MTGVMLAAMLSRSSLITLAGAAMLLAISLPCAALSRGRPHLREHVVDLWAMGLALLAMLLVPVTSTTHHGGGLALDPTRATCAIAVAWLVLRGVIATRGRTHAVAILTAVATAAGLVAMMVVGGPHGHSV